MPDSATDYAYIMMQRDRGRSQLVYEGEATGRLIPGLF